MSRLRLPSETTVGHRDTHEQGRGIYSLAAGSHGATSDFPLFDTIGKYNPLQCVGQIYAPDLRNGTIAMGF